MSENNVIQITTRTHKNCRHGRIRVNEELAYVECGLCGQHLNPIWVLAELGRQEQRFVNRLNSLNDAIDKSKNKIRCKCEYCKQMTRIIR